MSRIKKLPKIPPPDNVRAFPDKEQRMHRVAREKDSQIEVGTATLVGPSLSRRGLFDGDVLIFKKNCEKNEITQDSMCMVRLPGFEDLEVRHLRFDGDEVLARPFDGGKEVSYAAEDVEILGIVFQYQRVLDPSVDRQCGGVQ